MLDFSFSLNKRLQKQHIFKHVLNRNGSSQLSILNEHICKLVQKEVNSELTKMTTENSRTVTVFFSKYKSCKTEISPVSFIKTSCISLFFKSTYLYTILSGINQLKIVFCKAEFINFILQFPSSLQPTWLRTSAIDQNTQSTDIS